MSAELHEPTVETTVADGAGSWRTCIVVLAVALAAWVALYGATAWTLARVWWDVDNYSHGMIVYPASLWLIWVQRDALRALTPRPWWPGAALVALWAAAWAFSKWLGVEAGAQVAIVLLLPSLVAAVAGPAIGRKVLFPFLYVLLAVPVWNVFSPPLQDTTASATEVIVRALGVPLYREGYYLTIPSGRFVVAEVCSGLRYVLAAMALCALYAYLNISSFWRGVVLFVAGLIAAVLFNWIRVSGIVLIGHYSEMQSDLISDHVFYGWVVFVVAMLPVLALGYWLSEPLPEHPEGTRSGVVPRGPNSSAVLLGGCVAIVALFVGPALERYAARDAAGMPAIALPAATAGWSSDPDGVGGWRAELHGVDAEATARYRRGDAAVDLYVGAYRGQRQGVEVVNDLNHPYPGSGWKTSGMWPTSKSAEVDGDLVAIETFVVADSGADGLRPRLVWSWYRVAGRFTGSDVAAKLMQLRVLAGATPVAAMVVVSTPVDRDPGAARELLRDFVRDHRAGIARALARLEG